MIHTALGIVMANHGFKKIIIIFFFLVKIHYCKKKKKKTIITCPAPSFESTGPGY
jgi:hypothetical protein